MGPPQGTRKWLFYTFLGNDSRCTGRYPDVRDTGQDTTEEHRRE